MQAKPLKELFFTLIQFTSVLIIYLQSNQLIYPEVDI